MSERHTTSVGTSARRTALVAFIVVAFLMAAYLAVLRVGPKGEIETMTQPFFVPLAKSFLIAAATAIAYLCYGQYAVLGSRPALFIGLAFTADAVLSILSLLASPDLARLGFLMSSPNASLWFTLLSLTVLSAGLAIAAFATRQGTVGRASLRFAAVAAVAFAAGILVLGMNGALPQVVLEGQITPLGDRWCGALALVFGVASVASLRRYMSEGDTLLAYTSLATLILGAALVGCFVGGDPVFWLSTAWTLGLVAYSIVLFGLLHDYIFLFGESERGRGELRAVLEAVNSGIILTGAEGRVRYLNGRVGEIFGLDTSPFTGEPASRALETMGRLTTSPDWARDELARLEARSEDSIESELELTEPRRILHWFAGPVYEEGGRVLGRIEVFLDVTEDRRHEREAEALANIAAALVREVSFEEVAKTLADQTVEAMGFDVVEVWEAELERRELRIVAQRGLTPAGAAALQRLSLDAPYAVALAARTGRIQVIEDISKMGPEVAGGRALAEKEGLRNLIAVPLVVRGELVGTVMAGSRRQRRFSARDLEFFRTLADLFAGGLEKARLYKQLQTTLRLREEFLRDTAHELRTPVTAIRGYTHLLLKTLNQREQRARQLVELLGEQVDRLARLVDDLIDVAEVQADHFKLRRERFELTSLAREVVESVQQRSPQHHVVLEAEPAFVEADRVRVRRLLTDLLDGAIASMPRGGDVRVSIRIQGKMVVTAVTDYGFGIPKERQPHVFEPFYPLWAPGEPGYRPTRGVGLYLDRAIVRAHGGDLWFESTPGKGSTFYFSLPLSG